MSTDRGGLTPVVDQVAWWSGLVDPHQREQIRGGWEAAGAVLGLFWSSVNRGPCQAAGGAPGWAMYPMVQPRPVGGGRGNDLVRSPSHGV